MKRYLKTAVYATALLLGSVSADAVLSAATAQTDVSVSFDSFHDQLAQYGDWVYSDRWGEVWIPGDVPEDFHPYGTRGHWVDTDEYGWLWASDYEWGDIPFHYGRWVNDPEDGWMWLPGYVWSPGWVVWRNNGQYTGWMPMPPDDEFLGRRPSTAIGISIGGLSISFNNTDDDYGYSRWYGRDYGRDRFASNWLFIRTGHIGERDYSRYQAPRNNYQTLIRDSHNTTNYTVVNNYIVNRSVDSNAVRKAGGRFETVPASQVIKRPQFVARADTGSQIQARMRTERPRGSGLADSAPKPTATQIQSLSTKAPRALGGKAPAHLFTRDTVTKAPLAQRPGGPAPATIEAPKPVTPAERRDIKRGILPTTEAPMGKPAIKAPPAMEKRIPGAVTPPKEAPATPAETPREKIIRDRAAPPVDTKPATATPAETARGKMRDLTAPPVNATTPVETPRERVRMQRPVTEPPPAAATSPAAEAPRVPRHAPNAEVPAMMAHPAAPVEQPVPRHAPNAEVPAMTARPAAPVEHPAAVERPKPPVEVHAPVEPKGKKEPPKKPKDGEPGDGH
ncbi:MAG TPA: DUF6600 domain-containing protein [Rhizomicrobium sp.]|jgi:hypothetical protein